MPNPQRLDVLRQLREAAQLTQADMALICGLRGRQSHQTAGAWERGAITPDARRRKRFIGYLWDDLGLRRDPARFEAVWRILVEEWNWKPIDTAEWATFTHADRPAVGTPDPTAEDTPGAEFAPHSTIRRTLDVALYAEAGAVRGRPARLFGREALLTQIQARLDAGEHVLLHGLGGAGKTVLAATVAATRLEAGHGAVIWLHAGGASGAMLYTGLVEHFLPPPERGALREEGGLISAAAVAELLARLSPSLIIADDVWDGSALYQLMQALPPDVPLLVTSRLLFPRMTRIEVGDLAPRDAVTLLAHTAGRRTLGQDEGAQALCATLGFHPYALEIAGTVLELDPMLTPARLQQQIAQAPHAMPMPAGFAAEGRASVKYLLDHSVDTLDPAVQDVLAAFGILYAPGATALLLAALLNRDPWAVETALRELSVRSLARQTKPGYYELHDLTFSYVQALDEMRASEGVYPVDDTTPDDTTVNAAIARYVAQNRDDFATLELDQANVLAAADAARVQDPPIFLSIMVELAQGGYFDARGHTQQHMGLLDEAIALTVEFAQDDEELRHYLLSKRGNALVAEGDYARAVTVYEAALACAPTTARRIILEAVLGKTHALAGQHEAAARRFQIATQLAEAHNDIESLCTVLMQQSHAAAQAQDFASERKLALRGVQLSKQHGRTDDTGYFYLNLGSAEFELGVHEALARHQDAYTYAVRADNEALLAIVHHALGLDYLGLEDAELASSHLAESLRLFEKVGHADEAERLRRFIIGIGKLAEKLNSGEEL